MASLQKKGNAWYCQFYWRDRRFTFSVGRVAATQAEARATRAAEIVDLLARGVLQLPDGVGVVDFVKFDGKPPARGDVTNPVAKPLTLGALRDQFLAAREAGREASTQATSAIHFRHLARALGESFALPSLTLADLQRYVRSRPVSATTSRKEVTTLRTAWHWAVASGLLAGEFPNQGLIYPKEDELPPYRTMEEIARLARGMSGAEAEPLWEALYLRPTEVAELLEHVREHARHPWVYPLACMAAHTGARRSELIRAEVADVNFAGGTVTISEKKRVKGKRSIRSARLTPTLAEALWAWLAVHPGGGPLFCRAGEVARSRKRSATTGHRSKARPTTSNGRAEAVRARDAMPVSPLTPSEVHDHFGRTPEDSPWAVVKGLHTLRHSFISALAAAGVDQRIIDDIVGHTSEEMRRRYRHIVPNAKAAGVAAVFG